MPMLTTKEFQKRAKARAKRNANKPVTATKTDKYFDAVGEVMEKYPMVRGVRRRGIVHRKS